MEKTLFLVTGILVKSQYMCNADDGVRVTRIVSASSKGEAEAVMTCFYERKSDCYSLMYRVHDLEATEIITLDLTEEEKEKYSYKLN